MSKLDVAVIMGSISDSEFLKPCTDTLRELGISYELKVLSAHRDPDRLLKYVKEAEEKGVQVFIAAAGGAAHLPGVIASHTLKPVIGVPVPSSFLSGLDSLLSIVQMPSGIPVATVAVGKAGPVNAAVLACRILSLKRKGLYSSLTQFMKKLADRSRGG